MQRSHFVDSGLCKSICKNLLLLSLECSECPASNYEEVGRAGIQRLRCRYTPNLENPSPTVCPTEVSDTVHFQTVLES